MVRQRATGSVYQEDASRMAVLWSSPACCCDGAGLASAGASVARRGGSQCVFSLQRHVAGVDDGSSPGANARRGNEASRQRKAPPPVGGESACHSPEAQYVHSSWGPLHLFPPRDASSACAAFLSSPLPHSAARACIHSLSPLPLHRPRQLYTLLTFC